MNRMIRRRPSPALVVSFVALFVALGGVSYGIATITSADIKNNTIKSRDVRNGKLLGKDLKRGAIKGREVNEARLGIVPNATRAQVVDGHNLARLDFRAPAATPTRTILSLGGLILNATCTPAGDLNLSATTSINNSAVHVGTINLSQGNASYADSNDLDLGESVNALPARDTRIQGSLTYLSSTGAIVNVSYLAQEQTNGFGSVNDCFVVGTASQSPA